MGRERRSCIWSQIRCRLAFEGYGKGQCEDAGRQRQSALGGRKPLAKEAMAKSSGRFEKHSDAKNKFWRTLPDICDGKRHLGPRGADGFDALDAGLRLGRAQGRGIILAAAMIDAVGQSHCVSDSKIRKAGTVWQAELLFFDGGLGVTGS